MTTFVSKPYAINIGEKGVTSKAYVVEGILQSNPPDGRNNEETSAHHGTRPHVAVAEYEARINCIDRIIIFLIDTNDNRKTLSVNSFVNAIESMIGNDSSEPSSSVESVVRKSCHNSIAYAYRIVSRTTCISDDTDENCMPMWLLKRRSSYEYCLERIGSKSSELSSNSSGEVTLSLYDLNSPRVQACISQLLKKTIVPTKEFSTYHKCIWSLKDQSEADKFLSVLHSGEKSDMDATFKSSKEPRTLSSLVVTVRRTSRSVANVPISYEVVDEKVTITEQTKRLTPEHINSRLSLSSSLAGTTDKGYDFCFIQPDDLNLLTDYHALVFAQVKRGVFNANDLDIYTRKAETFEEFFRGMCCRHCGGNDKGSYFPISAKNIQSLLLSLHDHLLKCPSCPDDIKRALKIAQTKHTHQLMDKPKRAQTIFRNGLWERIQNETFDSGDEDAAHVVATHLNRIVQECDPKARADSKYYIEQDEVEGNVALSAANVISCDEDVPRSTDLAASRLPLGALRDDLKESSICIDDTFCLGFTPRQGIDADDDFGEALALLQQAPTPCSKFISEPAESVNITPQPIRSSPKEKQRLTPPIPHIISSIDELDHNGTLIVSDKTDAKLSDRGKEAKWKTNDNKRRKIETRDNALTRKLTMDDDILLIRGILRYGKKWKTIRDNEPRLHHIMHSALKDRTRSKRFQAKLLKAEANPSILNTSHGSCGGEHQLKDRSDEMSSSNGYGSESSYASNTVTATTTPSLASRKSSCSAVTEFHLSPEVALDPLFLLRS